MIRKARIVSRVLHQLNSKGSYAGEETGKRVQKKGSLSTTLLASRKNVFEL
jgi:hypothetical protein